MHADGDLIVDGCLWEVKATQNNYFDRRIVYQLVGYSLLDIEDSYKIDTVGLYRARFGCAQQWPLRDLLTTLAAEPVELDRIRAEFCTVARHCRW